MMKGDETPMIARPGARNAPRINLATAPDFELGTLRVRPMLRQVCSRGGACRVLEPRVMQVLVALARAGGEVVSRDQLIELCWDGRIVGDDSINRCIVAVRRLAREVTPTPFTIITVSRVGYRLQALTAADAAGSKWSEQAGPEAERVRVNPAASAGGCAGEEAPAAKEPQRAGRLVAVAALAALILVPLALAF